jgi:hypothetical protein
MKSKTMKGEETATMLMYGYMVFAMFIAVFVALGGSDIFGASFPSNPFANADPLTLLTAPLYVWNTIYYFFQITIFFLTAQQYWWLNFIFLPAGIIFLYLLAKLAIQLIQAVWI